MLGSAGRCPVCLAEVVWYRCHVTPFVLVLAKALTSMLFLTCMRRPWLAAFPNPHVECSVLCPLAVSRPTRPCDAFLAFSATCSLCIRQVLKSIPPPPPPSHYCCRLVLCSAGGGVRGNRHHGDPEHRGHAGVPRRVLVVRTMLQDGEPYTYTTIHTSIYPSRSILSSGRRSWCCGAFVATVGGRIISAFVGISHPAFSMCVSKGAFVLVSVPETVVRKLCPVNGSILTSKWRRTVD